MTSQRSHEFSSALVGIRFLRVVLPYVVLLVGALVVWNGLVRPHDVYVMLAFSGMWVGADILVRYAEWRAKSVEAELESLDREIAAEIDRLAAAGASGQ